MRKIYNNILAIVTSVLMIISCFIIPTVAIAESDTNIFTIEYTEDNGNVEITLSIGGNIDLSGFNSALTYDKSKYSIVSAKSTEGSTLVNTVPSKGKIAIACTATTNFTKETTFCDIVLESSATPDISDFNFEILERYNDLLDEDVDFTVNKVWNGKEIDDNVIPQQPETTTTSSAIVTTTTISSTTPPTTTTVATNTNSNDTNVFYYYYEENATEKCVEFVFGIKGDVKLASFDGCFELDYNGLSSPSLVESGAGMMAFYSEEFNEINYSFTSTTGENIEESMVFFKYTFDITDKDYTLTIKPNISSVSSATDYIDDYTIVNEDESYSPSTSTTSTTTTPTSTTTTTTTSTTTTTTTSTTTTTTTSTTTTTTTSTTTTTTTSTTTTTTTSTTTTTTTSTTTTTTTSTTTTTTTSTTTTTTSSATTTTESVTTSSTDETTISTTNDSEESAQTTTTVQEINASPYELANWAENDYYQKTGIEAYRSEYQEIIAGILTVTLYDEEGNVLDVYHVSTKTGIGTDDDGSEVNLPQTGYAVSTGEVTAIALIFIMIGSLFVGISFYRKKREE